MDLDKAPGTPLFTAADMLAHRRRQGRAPDFAPPGGAILCYQGSALSYAAKKYGGRKASGFYGQLFRLRKAGENILVLGHFGLGGPAVAVLIEELAAYGTSRFISVGLAGGLQPSATEGDLVIAAEAIAEDGVSPHYLVAPGVAVPEIGLAHPLAHALKEAGQSYRLGSCWTTSAPYREGRRQLARLQEAGVLAVEMEAATLYAVARAVNAQACAAFVISDSLANGTWRPGTDEQRQERGLRRLVDAAVMVLKQ